MHGSNYEVSVQSDYVLVERPQNFEVFLDEQPALLEELMTLCKRADTRNVLILGPKTKVRLSIMDIFELGSQIANSHLRIAIVEDHDATGEDAEFLENTAWNRGGLIQFFDSRADAENWLGISQPH